MRSSWDWSRPICLPVLICHFISPRPCFSSPIRFIPIFISHAHFFFSLFSFFYFLSFHLSFCGFVPHGVSQSLLPTTISGLQESPPPPPSFSIRTDPVDPPLLFTPRINVPPWCSGHERTAKAHSRLHPASWAHLQWPLAIGFHTSFPLEENCQAHLSCTWSVYRRKCPANHIWCPWIVFGLLTKPQKWMRGDDWSHGSCVWLKRSAQLLNSLEAIRYFPARETMQEIKWSLTAAQDVHHDQNWLSRRIQPCSHLYSVRCLFTIQLPRTDVKARCEQGLETIQFLP